MPTSCTCISASLDTIFWSDALALQYKKYTENFNRELLHCIHIFFTVYFINLCKVRIFLDFFCITCNTAFDNNKLRSSYILLSSISLNGYVFQIFVLVLTLKLKAHMNFCNYLLSVQCMSTFILRFQKHRANFNQTF